MQVHYRCLLLIVVVDVWNLPLRGADEKSVWDIQQRLVSKKYVDLTHAFAPGIPRWPGFPDETRKTIYWYDKRPDTQGTGSFRRFSHTSDNGVRTLIRRRTSLRGCEQ